ncbi:MAG: hypothetical protein CME69_12295 [Halobacteriovorax sp.]|nr:hypothetical protein [Halobacteriovorax sp.]
MSKKLLYFGKDQVYFNSLRNRIDQDGFSDEFELISMFFDEDSDKNFITTIVSEIASLNAQIILIDFSIDKDKVSLLARHLRLTLDPKETSLVGLLNQVEPDSEESSTKEANDNSIKKDFLQASLTHIPIIHYKGTSLGQIIFDSTYLFDGDAAFRPAYATFKNFKRELSAKYFSSITHILNDHLIIESSLNFDEEAIIELESDFLVHLNNKHVKVERKSTQLLQTKFSKRYRLSMDVIEQTKPDDVVLGAQENIEENKEKYNLVDKTVFNHYINSLDRTGQSKKVKLLLVQDGLEVLQQMEQSLSELPYLIRYQTSFRKNMKVVSNFRPHLIGVEFGEKINDIKELIKLIKEIEDYDPVINIFNTDLSGASLREELDYKFIMTHQSSINLELLLNMLEIYDKKYGNFDPATADPLVDEGESPFLVYALNPMSRIKLHLDIVLTSISEHEITFLCSEELPERGVLILEDPIKMYVTIQKPVEKLENERGMNHYFGLINGITTLELQKLRQHVNDMFLAEKRQKELEEKEAFAKLNKDKASGEGEAEQSDQD